jgi:hypothetical protein
MTELPIGIGDGEAQTRFLGQNANFLAECRKLYALLEKVFVRALVNRKTEHQDKEILQTQVTEADKIADEERRMAQVVVFYLGRAAADDFGEVIILAGNGRGIGAHKILRGMYERVVTAAFIAKNPSEAHIFLSHSFIEREKLLNRLKEILPDIKDERTPEQIREFEVECEEAKAKLKASICNKCKQPITQKQWTRVNLETMAQQADASLGLSYAYCYLLPTFHSHATAFGLESRIRMMETGFSFKETSEPEARKAVLYAHGLILRLLRLQNDYFGLGLDAEIDGCWNEFPKIWTSQADEQS